LRDVGLLFLDFLVLFKELVKQHRIDCIVAHGKRLAISVGHYQVGIYLRHVFRNQTKLRRVFGFFGVLVFVMKCDRFKRQDGFAGLIRWLNVFLKAARGVTRAELAVGVYDNIYAIAVSYCNPANVADKASVTCCEGSTIAWGSDEITLLAVVMLAPASRRMAMLSLPVLNLSAPRPKAWLFEPDTLSRSAAAPTAVLLLPSTLFNKANRPTAVLSLAVVLLKRASKPIAVCSTPSILLKSAKAPVAVLDPPSGVA
jgi:hypothetical protein